jgi:CRP-like cAMP-binding protein
MPIDDDIALMEAIPSLGALGRDALRILAIGIERRSFNEGDTLYREGQAADAAFLIEAGNISLRRRIRNETVELGQAGAGVLLGETALISAAERTATAIALSPAYVIRISRVLFLRMCEGYPDAPERLRRLYAERVRETNAELRRLDLKLSAADR